jgi:hypothetical protein
MKKQLLIAGMILFIISTINAKDNILVSLNGNMLFPADSNYKSIYTDSIFYPELKLAVKLLNNFYLWAGYGLISESGQTPTLQLETSSKQRFFSFGAGYDGHFSSSFGFRAELGGFSCSYEESALELEESGSAFGVRLDGAVLYFLNRSLTLELWVGYLMGNDKISLGPGEEISLKLGGLKMGAGIGVRI